MTDSRPVISVEPSWHDTHESRCLKMAGCNLTYRTTPNPDTVAVGSVEYCRTWHKWPARDPYPDWLPWGRKIIREGNPGEGYFYKPADVPKRFTSEIKKCPPSGRWVASAPVKFVVEYRAYILNGLLLACHSYEGTEGPAPFFPWVSSLPRGLTAAIDYGHTKDDRLLPIEVNDPYAIGWYGSLADHAQYARFVFSGWQYMLENA